MTKRLRFDKHFFYPLLFAFSLLVLTACSADKQATEVGALEIEEGGLVLILTLDKNSYQGNEPIWGTLVIKNVNLRNALVNKRMFPSASYNTEGVGNIAFVITSPDGQILELGNVGVHPTPFSNDDFVNLTVGQGIQFSEYRIDLLFGGKLNKNGKYGIQGFYANQLDPYDKRTAWKGELQSNLLEFEYKP